MRAHPRASKAAIVEELDWTRGCLVRVPRMLNELRRAGYIAKRGGLYELTEQGAAIFEPPAKAVGT